MNIVSQLSAPLYDAGYRLPRVSTRYRQTVAQPAYPLYDGWGIAGVDIRSGLGPRPRISQAMFPGWRLGLGAAPAGGPGVLTASAPIVGTVATDILATSTMTAGTAFSALAGPIGAGIGILIGVIAGLWAAHNARVAGATHENQAINSAVNTWDQGMKAIFAAANSSNPAQNVSGPQAAQQVQQLWGTFWQMMSPLIGAPGTADTSMRGQNCGSSTLNPAGACAGTPGGHKCDKSCTATCCVGCQDLYPSMLQAIQVLNSPAGGTVQVCAIAGSGYGAQARSGYTLTYSPPAIAAAGGAGAPLTTDLTAGISSLFGGTAATGGSLLPLLAVGALAFFLLR